MAVETFLNDTIEQRIVPMLREVGAMFPRAVGRVIPYWTDKTPTPAWMIYPIPPMRQTYASRGETAHVHQTYTLGMRLYYAPAEAGYVGVKEEFVGWQLIPTVLEYFTARRGLCYQAAQTVPAWLEPNQTTITTASPFGMFPDAASVVGCEFVLSLTFQRVIQSVHNNP